MLDAHRLLQQPRGEGDEGAILVVQVVGRLIGLEVGEVRDFFSLPESSVAAREQLPGVDPVMVRAVARHEGEHFVILDLDALCGPVLSSERVASS